MTLFTSMGMFIIDEIHFPPESRRKSHYDVIGGGGTYGALGSRIITKRSSASQVGWIIDKGSDFPLEVENYLRTWETGVVWRETPERLTTRGWNMYGDRDFRAFKYLAEKKRINVEDLIANDTLLYSDSYHLLCSPQRCIQILDSLKHARVGETSSVPIVVWEPVPDLCLPENLDDTLSILDTVNVLTPNAEEAARFFNMEEPTEKSELEALATKFVEHIKSNSIFNTGGGIVLRCGPLGSFTLTSTGLSAWIPAYYNEKNPESNVVDPTGGGNTFIGAFATGFVLSRGDWIVASICGNIGASVAIEQIGMPEFDPVRDLWNGKTFEERLKTYVTLNEIDVNVDEVLRALDPSKKTTIED